VGGRGPESTALCGQVNEAREFGQELSGVSRQASVGLSKLVTLFMAECVFHVGQLAAPFEHLEMLDSADVRILSVYYVGSQQFVHSNISLAGPNEMYLGSVLK